MVKRKKLRSHAPTRKSGGKPASPIIKKLTRLLPSLVVAAALVFVFSKLGPLHKLQTFVSDTAMRIAKPPMQTDVAIIEITDDDYQSLFKRESPLDPLQLQRLLTAIALSHPKLIAVDIDTSPEKYQHLSIDNTWPPIVWERDVEKLPESEEEKLKPMDKILGRSDEQLLKSSGLPVFLDDPEDGMTRRYTRYLPTETGNLPTLPEAIIQKLGGSRSTNSAPLDKFFIRFTGRPEQTKQLRESQGMWLSAAELLDMSQKADWPNHPENRLRGKIVLLGGTYGDDDIHFTPVGRMYGVQIIAQVLETELAGGGDRAPAKAAVILLELFECVAVVLLFHAFHKRSFFRVLAISLLSVVVIAVICSLISFGSVTRATTYIPVLLCVLIYEFAVEYRAEAVTKLASVFGSESQHGH
jgi:CHASE2 domain-containing protein